MKKITVLLIQPNPTHGWTQPMSISVIGPTPNHYTTRRRHTEIKDRARFVTAGTIAVARVLRHNSFAAAAATATTALLRPRAASQNCRPGPPRLTRSTTASLCGLGLQLTTHLVMGSRVVARFASRLEFYIPLEISLQRLHLDATNFCTLVGVAR